MHGFHALQTDADGGNGPEADCFEPFIYAVDLSLLPPDARADTVSYGIGTLPQLSFLVHKAAVQAPQVVLDLLERHLRVVCLRDIPWDALFQKTPDHEPGIERLGTASRLGVLRLTQPFHFLPKIPTLGNTLENPLQLPLMPGSFLKSAGRTFLVVGVDHLRVQQPIRKGFSHSPAF